ncbi:lysine-specific demethylase 5C-like [Petromyzon marinus]|uniref:lysine-specific demethylase 5C-like n=1 Tax=Petromyzon marinus TaxID=7757 RepID=UPI003F70968F
MGDHEEFAAPPECPVFEPSREEFAEPLAFIAKIRPIAEKTGICKIRPPADWQPPFAVDVDNFRFTPRIQRLNELEAQTRVKLNFLDQIAKFWELQGSTLKIPIVERRTLDLYTLSKVVMEEGGFEYLSRERKWARVSLRMGYPAHRGVGSLLRSHYERILYPYDLFHAGVSLHTLKNLSKQKLPLSLARSAAPTDKQDDVGEKDKEYKPHGIPQRLSVQPSKTDCYGRRAKRLNTEPEPTEADIASNPELKKLQIYGAGPKMMGLGLMAREKLGASRRKDGDVKQEPTVAPKLEPPPPPPPPTPPPALAADGGENSSKWEDSAGAGKQSLGPSPSPPVLARAERAEQACKPEPPSSPVVISDDDDDDGGGAGEVRGAGAAEEQKLEGAGGGGGSGGAALDGSVEQKAEGACLVCESAVAVETMLRCSRCGDGYHRTCLVPPPPEVASAHWRCPKCIAEECSKPHEAFGFEQATKEYTLQSFGEMADTFKADYFNMPVHMVPTDLVEREFWRLVNSIEEDVTVEYGADIHSREFGSGFPVRDQERILTPEEETYVESGWNLNIIPVHGQSVLGFINADISGMKVPWLYVGMCFSAFCWHIEDHWSYSINYLHWGEPKTWYGVPSHAAEHLESVMRKLAPELFESQPDLLHQLVTIMNPNLLMSHGVPVVRTNQCAGEFVVTFPRAYHSGFNQGYNFAEAVNFCTADWLPMGRLCVDHYRRLHRYCVFSHEELICKMASDPEGLGLNLAAAVHKELFIMVQEERKLRRALLQRGTTEAEREAFELLPDDERQCDTCKTTCFLSALACSRCHNRLVCLHHAAQLCKCPPAKHYLRYRYTLDELPAMLQRLKVCAESFDSWATRTRRALEAEGALKKELPHLQELAAEAEERKFPENDLSLQLHVVVTETERCLALVRSLLHARPADGSGEEPVERLTLVELRELVEQMQSLPCAVPEAAQVEELLERAERLEVRATEVAEEAAPGAGTVEALLRDIERLGPTIVLPHAATLRDALPRSRWLHQVRENLSQGGGRVPLDAVRGLLRAGLALPANPSVQKALSELQELQSIAQRWEEKAALCLQSGQRHSAATLEAIVADAEQVPAVLPKVRALTAALAAARQWSHLLEAMQNADHFPYLEVLESTVRCGADVAVRLDALPQLQAQVQLARAWRERTERTFLRRHSSYSVLEVLSPRTDIGEYGKRRPRVVAGDPKAAPPAEVTIADLQRQIKEARDPDAVVQSLKDAERREVEAIRRLRAKNASKLALPLPTSGSSPHRHSPKALAGPTPRPQQPGDPGVAVNNGDAADGAAGTGAAEFCLCRRPARGLMLHCELCGDWFHCGTCVPVPRSGTGRRHGPGYRLLRAPGPPFLCPGCQRSRRPRLVAILPLLLALQKLPARLAEGEALQHLTERAVGWQEQARQALAKDEVWPLMTTADQADNDPAAAPAPAPPPAGAGSGRLSAETTRELTELLVEGGLLEMSLEETCLIWRVLQAAQPEQLPGDITFGPRGEDGAAGTATAQGAGGSGGDHRRKRRGKAERGTGARAAAATHGPLAAGNISSSNSDKNSSGCNAAEDDNAASTLLKRPRQDTETGDGDEATAAAAMGGAGGVVERPAREQEEEGEVCNNGGPSRLQRPLGVCNGVER